MRVATPRRSVGGRRLRLPRALPWEVGGGLGRRRSDSVSGPLFIFGLVGLRAPSGAGHRSGTSAPVPRGRRLPAVVSGRRVAVECGVVTNGRNSGAGRRRWGRSSVRSRRLRLPRALPWEVGGGLGRRRSDSVRWSAVHLRSRRPSGLFGEGAPVWDVGPRHPRENSVCGRVGLSGWELGVTVRSDPIGPSMRREAWRRTGRAVQGWAGAVGVGKGGRA